MVQAGPVLINLNGRFTATAAARKLLLSAGVQSKLAAAAPAAEGITLTQPELRAIVQTEYAQLAAICTVPTPDLTDSELRAIIQTEYARLALTCTIQIVEENAKQAYAKVYAAFAPPAKDSLR